MARHETVAGGGQVVARESPVARAMQQEQRITGFGGWPEGSEGPGEVGAEGETGFRAAGGQDPFEGRLEDPAAVEVAETGRTRRIEDLRAFRGDAFDADMGTGGPRGARRQP